MTSASSFAVNATVVTDRVNTERRHHTSQCDGTGTLSMATDGRMEHA
jgi:hypothetical protein